MSKIKIGIVGIGNNCLKNYVPYLLELSEYCVISAICDINYRTHKNLKHVPNSMKLYTDFDEFIVDKEVDAVLITTPDDCHNEQLIAAVKAGKHVLCETPLATTTDEYDRLVNAINIAYEKKLIVTASNPMRFDPVISSMISLIATSRFNMSSVLHSDLHFEYHINDINKSLKSSMTHHLYHKIDFIQRLFVGYNIVHASKNFDSEKMFHVSVNRLHTTFSIQGKAILQKNIIHPMNMKIIFDSGTIFADMYHGKVSILDKEGIETIIYNPKCYKCDISKRYFGVNYNFLQIIRNGEYNRNEDVMLSNTKLVIDLHGSTFVQY